MRIDTIEVMAGRELDCQSGIGSFWKTRSFGEGRSVSLARFDAKSESIGSMNRPAETRWNATPRRPRRWSIPRRTNRQLRLILKTALSAPDHGRLHPYRFISIRGDARQRLSEVFGEATRQAQPATKIPAMSKKQKDKPLRSPLIVVVVAQPNRQSRKIPQIEQNPVGRRRRAQRAAGGQRARLRLDLADRRQRLRRLREVREALGDRCRRTHRRLSFTSARRAVDIPPRPIPEVSTHHTDLGMSSPS